MNWLKGLVFIANIFDYSHPDSQNGYHTLTFMWNENTKYSEVSYDLLSVFNSLSTFKNPEIVSQYMSIAKMLLRCFDLK